MTEPVAESTAAQASTAAPAFAVASPAAPAQKESKVPEEPRATVPRAPASPVGRPLAELGAFYDRLDALRSGRESGTLRVLWLGDSHTNADFMTDRVRLALQELGGAAGPGFVRVGLESYRHEGVLLEISGRWRKEPVLPAQRTRVKDGVFGYGGIRTIPLAGGRARVSLRRRAGIDAETPVSWRLSYRLPAGAALDVRLGSAWQRLRSGEGLADAALPSEILLPGRFSDALEVAHVAGEPEIFGAFVETERAGIVLDTVGIDGARTATPLAWEPEQFARAVEARAPELVVLAFGTNEVFDKTAPRQYGDHVGRLLDLVRQGAGPIPCWVIGPIDAPREGGSSRPRVRQVSDAERQAAEARGCAFTSAQELMGGEGSFRRWTEARPQLARGDGIHLTVAGYRELGDRLARALLGPPGADVPLLSAYFGSEAAAPARSAAAGSELTCSEYFCMSAWYSQLPMRMAPTPLGCVMSAFPRPRLSQRGMEPQPPMAAYVSK